jgi:hypothetical protein
MWAREMGFMHFSHSLRSDSSTIFYWVTRQPSMKLAYITKHLSVPNYFTLKMETASSSETSVPIYKATRCQYTEDNDLSIIAVKTSERKISLCSVNELLREEKCRAE